MEVYPSEIKTKQTPTMTSHLLALNQTAGLSDKYITANVQTTRKQNKQGPNVNCIYFELQIRKYMGENQKVSHLDLLHHSLLQQLLHLVTEHLAS